MTATNHPGKNEKLRRFSHILAALVIFMHGWERFETGHASYLFFFIAGVIFLLVAIFHHQLSARFPLTDAIFFMIEGFLSILIAYEYWHAGKKGLPWMYLIAGMFQVALIVRLYLVHKKAK